MKYISSFLVLLTLLFTGCNKKTGVEIVRLADYMIGDWKVRQAMMHLTNGSYQDITPTAACNLDNYYSFGSDSKVWLYEGPTKCISTNPDLSSVGTWQVYDEGTIIWRTISNTNQYWRVEQTTKTECKITQVDVNGAIIEYWILYRK